MITCEEDNMDKCIGIASRTIEQGEYIEIKLHGNGEITSPDLIIDPELKQEDIFSLFGTGELL